MSAGSAASAFPAPARATTAPGRSRRAVGRPAPAEDPAPAAGEGRVVQAADRFRALVVGRPWRRRRRAILASLAGVLALLLVAAGTAIYLPALQVDRVEISGLGYLAEDQVRAVVEEHDGDSVLLLRTGRIQQELLALPGVASAEVERSWPDGVSVTVTETAPVAVLTRADGSTAVLDAAGEELPAAAAEGATLVPLSVGAGASDPEGAAVAMSEVVGAIPEPLRSSVRSVTATTPSDVTLEIALEDGTVKTVIWGGAADSALKAEVVQALISQPGTVIDVSSPVAPVTR
ncbi:FtsQ-type POTRA domain-containing protein [Brachybacterium sp. J144]|uniref:cell division protein FtsQ/DivIB n=1 Tax=Brachybacterium sp. J144 TaxID=3116487 RepID=UPI002E793185|nr:FtsQ-type POTRA domain-containing protein [Brachybacterium sp. J144]MEE1649241.1 FtsQ-type POTRA domain-containing protein [Brachybacterium sp. J144]